MSTGSELTEIDSSMDEDIPAETNSSLAAAERKAQAATTEYNSYVTANRTSRKTRHISGKDIINSSSAVI